MENISTKRSAVSSGKPAAQSPAVCGCATREELDEALGKGVRSLRAGKCSTADEVGEMLAREFGV